MELKVFDENANDQQPTQFMLIASTINDIAPRLDKKNKFGVSIRDALVEFDDHVPTPKELAIICKFDDTRVQMIDERWNAAYDGGWIYVTKEMAVNEFGIPDSRHTMSNFYANILSKYTEGVDYMLEDHDSEFVKEYEKLIAPQLRKIVKSGRKPKYPFITGRTYKRILMKAATKIGDAQCNYFCDIEDLGIFFREYAAIVYQILAELARQESQKKDATITYLQQQIVTATAIELNQYIYIGTNNDLASKKIFKIGGVGSYDDLKARLQTYQTPNSDADPFVFVYIGAVSDFLHVEKRIAQALDPYRERPKSKKETFKVSQEYIVRRVDAIVKGFAAENAATNADADLMIACMTKPPTQAVVAAPWPEPPLNYQPQQPRRKRIIIEPQDVPQDPIAVIINAGIDNLTDEQKREIGRQLLVRVIPDIDFDKETTIPCNDIKREIINVSPGKDKKKAKIKKWYSVMKTAIANTQIKIRGRW